MRLHHPAILRFLVSLIGTAVRLHQTGWLDVIAKLCTPYNAHTCSIYGYSVQIQSTYSGNIMHRAREIQLDSIMLNLFLPPSSTVQNIRISLHDLDACFRISYFTRKYLVEAVTTPIIICLIKVGPSTPAKNTIGKKSIDITTHLITHVHTIRGMFEATAL